MMRDSIFWSLSLLLLYLIAQKLLYTYAEIHYAFKKGLSFIHRRRPELVADAPWRVRKGGKLPVLWVAKDADQFPIEMLQIDIALSSGGKTFRANLFKGERRMTDRISFNLEMVDLPEWICGRAKLDVYFVYRQDGLIKKVKNDNLPGLSHDGFEIYVSEHDLPKIEGWHYGDVHYHSDKTDDQVEFGAPIWVAKEMAKAMGLSWFAVTDHSYDLDIPPGEMFGLDTDLGRWKNLIEEIEEANGHGEDFAVLMGEEVSCGNSVDQNIHLLAFRSRRFIPGRGDGGKRGINLRNHPDLPLTEVLSLLRESGGYGYAAHPHEGSTFLSRLALNRGHWRDEDLTLEGCCGMQLWNGCSKIGLEIGYRHWIKLLLSGHRIFVVAGSDSHGDFNRFRRVTYPFFWVAEKRGSSFGRPRTCVLVPGRIDEESVHEALREGRCVVTDGPFGAIFAEDEGGRRAVVGQSVRPGRIKLEAVCLSTPEFGRIKRARLIAGDLEKKREITLSRLRTSSFEERFSCRMKIPNEAYFRLEVLSEKGRCLTNPIWVSSS
jgi:hypothetical protein